jgi:hypothetical protein
MMLNAFLNHYMLQTSTFVMLNTALDEGTDPLVMPLARNNLA